MKVYGHEVSGGTRLVLMALAEKKVSGELITLDFMRGEHRQPEHLARQPFAKMPAVDYQGTTLFESRAIARYIGEAFPGGAPFVPTDPWERALVDQWVNAETCEFYPAAHPLMIELCFKKGWGMGDPDPALVESLREKTKVVLAVLDAALAGNSYLVGDRFTLADMVYMPDLDRLHSVGEGSWISRFANVSRWWNTLASRPSWVAAKAGGIA